MGDEITSMLDAPTRIAVRNLLGDLEAAGLAVGSVTRDLSRAHAELTVLANRDVGLVAEQAGDVPRDKEAGW